MAGIFPVNEILKQLEYIKANPVKYYVSHDLQFKTDINCCILHKVYKDNKIEVIHSMSSKNRKEIEEIVKWLTLFFDADVVELLGN